MVSHNPKLACATAILASAYRFRNPDLLCEALHAAGLPYQLGNPGGPRPGGNKPLAGVGDRVISLVITDRAYDNQSSIGITNFQIQSLTNNMRLASLCDNMSLTPCIVANTSQQGMVSPITKAATVEALVGAVFKDSGKDVKITEHVMEHLGIISSVGASEPKQVPSQTNDANETMLPQTHIGREPEPQERPDNSPQ